MNARIAILRLSLALGLVSALLSSGASAQETGPHLLLTPRRLHRLKLDRQRQTDRWMNFEQRVKSAPDSPERGFELALYYAVTQEERAGRDAIAWAMAHSSELEQRLLVADWCTPLLSATDRETLASTGKPKNVVPDPASAARNLLFESVVRGQDPSSDFKKAWDEAVRSLKNDPTVWQPEQLYSLFEAIDAMQTNFRDDLRREDSDLFSQLPAIFLLSLSPKELEQPGWKTRVAGLMMVNVDPNLQASSFVQGWAMEDPKQQKDGPGVGYEFLWANPYLPGLGYYNMEPWVYLRDSGFLIARANWDASACAVKQTPSKFESQRCPANVKSVPTTFAKLTLLPVTEPCIQVKSNPNRTTILSGLKPGSEVAWKIDGNNRTGTADTSGLLRLPFDAVGRICRSQ
jgi:hypothetical protein